MVAEEAVVTLSGGAPWGFRLQGGVEHQKALQVAKVRKRSKACRAGLREGDELVSINEQPCGTLSHAKAMELIDSSPGILHIRVRRSEEQSVVLVTRAPSPRIDKEYRAALRAMSPNRPHHAPVREVHRSHSSITSGLTSPPGSEAYYGETDSDADVAGYERQRRQKRRSPSNSNPGKPPPVPGLWSSQTSTETSSIISSADDQGQRDAGQEVDSGFLEPSHVPLVSPERAKEAMMLGSRSQLVPMVGPVNKPLDEELTTTYKEKAKQAKLNRGDTVQDKNVKEAKSKCRTIASLLTDAPNPHSKGVLMFKKRRQRSKKYTLTSFGSVDEDRCQDSQEEDGVFPGSESELDEDGFSAVPDPTWDSDYLDVLEKRATAGTEGRGDGAENDPTPGLSDTTGKGAQLFEQQRKRAAEHAQKVEAAQPTAPVNSNMMMSTPPVAPKPVAASMTVLTIPAPPAETPLPELPSSNVLNRTARPFTPGFISLRSATVPVTFRPSVTKTSQRPASAAVVQSRFSTGAELTINAISSASHPPPGPPSVFSPPSFAPQGHFAQTPDAPVTFHPAAASNAIEKMQSSPQMTATHQPSFAARPKVSAAPQAPMAPAPAFPVPEAVAPTPVPGQTGRTGILNDARRRGGKPKPMFNVPEVKKNSPNPELLCMVQNLDDRSTRHKYGQPPPEAIYDDVEEERSVEAGMGRAPPPVAPKPRVIHETPQFLQAGGKGAELFARRQSRMGMYVVDTPLETPYQQEVTSHRAATVLDYSPNPSCPSQWKYSPNVRAPPPIGYNPLLAPSIPTGPQRNTGKPDSMGRGGSQREGIKALDAMSRQPYQLNSAMFNNAFLPDPEAAGGLHDNNVKTGRVFEVKRFSTPTPMSAPTLATKVIAPRSATTLGERLTDSRVISPPPANFTPAPAPFFKPAPVSAWNPASPPSQAPKPRFVATKGGVQARVWRPGA
uniref:Synaptopodin 2-like protein n=1 Tax=Gasterosteus aculeatus TaxID=69293 RepID=G3PA02_GASAC